MEDRHRRNAAAEPVNAGPGGLSPEPPGLTRPTDPTVIECPDAENVQPQTGVAYATRVIRYAMNTAPEISMQRSNTIIRTSIVFANGRRSFLRIVSNAMPHSMVGRGCMSRSVRLGLT